MCMCKLNSFTVTRPTRIPHVTFIKNVDYCIKIFGIIVFLKADARNKWVSSMCSSLLWFLTVFTFTIVVFKSACLLWKT